MTLTLDQIEALDDSLIAADIDLRNAESGVRQARNVTYRLPEAEAAAVAEAEAARTAVAASARQAADALDAAVREFRTSLADVDPVAVYSANAKMSVRTFWKSEAESAPLSDLVADVRAALSKNHLPTLATVVRFVSRRLADAPTGSFDQGGYSRPKDDGDQVHRDRLRTLLDQARERLVLKPDPEVVSRLDELSESVQTTRKSTDPYKPKREYRFQQPGDRITQPAE